MDETCPLPFRVTPNKDGLVLDLSPWKTLRSLHSFLESIPQMNRKLPFEIGHYLFFRRKTVAPMHKCERYRI